MQNHNLDIPLRDIKPLLEIHEYSFYYFLGISVAVILSVSVIAYFIYRWFVHRNRFNLRKEHYKLLNEIDLSDTKKAAYALTMYGATFKDDGQRQTQMYHNLLERLEAFKYKKDVDKFDNEIIGYIELYKGMIDV